MKSTLRIFTVAILLLAQAWISLFRSQEICVSVEASAEVACDQTHDHDHGAPVEQSNHSDPCDHCIHIQTPDNQFCRAKKLFSLPTLEIDAIAPIENLWRIIGAMCLQDIPIWNTDAFDPSGLASTVALKVTKLII
jgi:hypothetical protein